MKSKLDEQAFAEMIEGQGFTLLASLHLGSLGYGGLLVAIRKQPTDEHFDPERLQLPLRDDDGVDWWRTLSLLSPSPASAHVCPGRLILVDRFEKRLEFFSFGGTLQVTRRSGEMWCSISSPAPILELVTEQETVIDQLAAEAEALWAGVRANWGIADEEFERRLALVEPLSLYMTTLHTLLSRWKSSPALEQTYHQAWEMLSHEKHWLVGQGLWPSLPLTLEGLLAPDAVVSNR